MFGDIGNVTAAAAAVKICTVILALMILILRVLTALIEMGPAFPWSVIRETHWKSSVAIRSLRTLEVASLIFSGTIITGKSGRYLTCTDLSILIFEMDLTRKLRSDQIRSVHVRSIAIVLSETFNDSGDG